MIFVSFGKEKYLSQPAGRGRPARGPRGDGGRLGGRLGDGDAARRDLGGGGDLGAGGNIGGIVESGACDAQQRNAPLLLLLINWPQPPSAGRSFFSSSAEAAYFCVRA